MSDRTVEVKMDGDATPTCASVLPLVFGADLAPLLAALERFVPGRDDVARNTILRLALQQTGRTTRWYQALLNLWVDAGKPSLKPNPVSQRVSMISNYTADNMAPLMTAFPASLGVHLDVDVCDYDAIELHAFNPHSPLYDAAPDVIVVLWSEHWLHRHLGAGCVVSRSDLERCIEAMTDVITALRTNGSAQILVSSFVSSLSNGSAGWVQHREVIGRSAAIARLNTALHEHQDDRIAIVNVPDAIHEAGGQLACSATNYTRAKMPYTANGTIEIARELGAAIAAQCGKSHRALITDLDNTLWGGIIADVGADGIVTGHHSADAEGYLQLQEHLKGMKALGMLLGIASKNDPSVAAVFESNSNIALSAEDFSTRHISWNPKSRSIATTADELGFGAEFMLFVDDNIFELAEAITEHPSLDVVLAQADPLETRALLTRGRYFHAVRLTDDDRLREERIASKRESEGHARSFTDYGEYLRSLNIQLRVDSLGDHNRDRVVQLLQKTNQFNLTTRRHNEAALRALEAAGATIGVVSYEDTFGTQGIISVVILVPDRDSVRVETWVMSCRVLNRTVEIAVGDWIIAAAGTRVVVGEYIETAKNSLVRDLYDRLGFSCVEPNEGKDRMFWSREPTDQPTECASAATLDSGQLIAG